jgi:hypothetical protein
MLCCTLPAPSQVVNVRREARLADHLSRETSTAQADWELLGSHQMKRVPKTLDEWLKNPPESYICPSKLNFERSGKESLFWP